MILREFGFTCQRPIGENEKEFENRSRSIFSGASAFLKRDIRTDGIWKVSIHINSSNAVQHMKTVGGILVYNINFNVDRFLKLDLNEQKHEMLALVIITLRCVFKEAGWKVERLDGLREFIERREFKTTFKGPSSSHDGIRAYIECEQCFDRANIFVVLKCGRQEMERIFVLETAPEEFIFNAYRNAPQWISDSELCLKVSGGEIIKVRRSPKISPYSSTP